MFGSWRVEHRPTKQDFRVAMLRSLWNSQDGVAVIEFAAVVSMLCVMVIGVIDLGYGFWEKMEVGNAARAGAQYTVANYGANGFSSSGVQQAMANATGLSTIQASPVPTKSCGCPSSTGIQTVPCNAGCGGGGSPATYVTVNAQLSYSTLFTWPGIGNPVTLSAKQTVRVN